MSDFGSYIKKLRKQKQLSLKDVAKKGGISHSYISQIENKHRNPPKPEIISKLAKGLDAPEYSLLREAGYILKKEPKKEEMQKRVLGMLAEEFHKEKANAPERFDIYKIIDFDDYEVIFEGLYRDFNEEEREAIAVTLRYILPLLEGEIAQPHEIIEEIDNIFYKLGGK